MKPLDHDAILADIIKRVRANGPLAPFCDKHHLPYGSVRKILTGERSKPTLHLLSRIDKALYADAR